MSTFSLKVIACDRVFYDGEVQSLIFPGFDGEMAILAHHESMTCTVEVGEIRFKLPDDTWKEAIVSEGFLRVEDNEVTMIVFSAETPEEIDEFRAQAALERAKEQLQQKQSRLEYEMTTASMARAMARLSSSKKRKML